MMQWLIALETDRELITLCRLLNIFRRKGPKISALATARRPEGFSVVVVAEASEAEIDHSFNFLRRTEGVQHVTCYRHEVSQKASFLFVDAGSEDPRLGRILEVFPGSKLVFASHGKFLFEVPAESRQLPAASAFGVPEFLPFACVKTTRSVQRAELASAPAS